MKQASVRKISIILFALGALIAFLLAVGTIWAHFEMPFFFNYSYVAVSSKGQQVSRLSCPVILTNADSGQVSVDIPNTTDKTINIHFQGEISSMDGTVREVEFRPAIPVAQTGRIQFAIDRNDVVFGNLILVRTYQFSTYKTPARAGSCAVLMFPISFLSGAELLILTILVSILLILSGIVLWVGNNRPMRGLPRSALTVMVSLSILLLLANVVGIAGWWIPGILILVVSILLAVVSIGYGQDSPSNDRF
jgi:hypothetical protein